MSKLNLSPVETEVAIYHYVIPHREDLHRCSERAMEKLRKVLEFLFGEESVWYSHCLTSRTALITVTTERRTSEGCIPIAVREIVGAIVVPQHEIHA